MSNGITAELLLLACLFTVSYSIEETRSCFPCKRSQSRTLEDESRRHEIFVLIFSKLSYPLEKPSFVRSTNQLCRKRRGELIFTNILKNKYILFLRSGLARIATSLNESWRRWGSQFKVCRFQYVAAKINEVSSNPKGNWNTHITWDVKLLTYVRMTKMENSVNNILSQLCSSLRCCTNDDTKDNKLHHGAQEGDLD